MAPPNANSMQNESRIEWQNRRNIVALHSMCVLVMIKIHFRFTFYYIVVHEFVSSSSIVAVVADNNRIYRIEIYYLLQTNIHLAQMDDSFKKPLRSEISRGK